jgi:membrane-bound inhibitor of C-type lysozyme
MRPSFMRLRVAAALAVAPVVALVAGCESNGGGRDLFSLDALTGSDRVAFRCDDDRSFRVNYNDGGEEAVVDAGRDTFTLDLRDRDGDRRMYEGVEADLFVDGDEARLRISGREDYRDCERA